MRRPTSIWFWRICSTPAASPFVLIFMATKRRSRTSGAVRTWLNSASIAGVRGEVSTTRRVGSLGFDMMPPGPECAFPNGAGVCPARRRS